MDLNIAVLILVHDRPSGDRKLSQSDTSMTFAIRDVGEVLGLPIHDHLIVGY